VFALAGLTYAGGTLTPVNSTDQPILIRNHQVRVVINNGFARTEVLQTFYNPNDHDVEAVYAFPLPRGSSLSEFTIYSGENEIHGEVLEKAQAAQVYEEEKAKGRDTGLATQEGFYRYRFNVWPVRALAETRMRFVYYQSLDIDTGVARYLYPLEEGGTDDVGDSFWTNNKKVENSLSINVEVKSAWPVDEVRVPGLEGAVKIERQGEGHLTASVDQPGGSLSKDFVLYYRLKEKLPGRIEMVPSRPAKDKPGTFMMVVTPGVDLKPISQGADYTFVLDVSGSMDSKIRTLAKGVSKAIGQLDARDRFRIVTFNDHAGMLTNGWVKVTPENVAAALKDVAGLTSGGSTNLHDGLSLGLTDLDADRPASVVLVTDGVANEGVIAPAAFQKLMKQVDVRLFGFLMGNEGNWPLLKLLCDTSGGFYAGVSNDDDIIGQILLAKSKLVHEAMHDVAWDIKGVTVSETTRGAFKKVYRGQQLVIFGRYETAGKATVTIKAKLSGEDKTYAATFDFPEINNDNPEIERLWALEQIEAIEARQFLGEMPENEARSAIVNLGVGYQVVTNHTSMVVASDEAFANRGIERRNKERTARERKAQVARAVAPIQNYQVDTSSPAFPGHAPSVGGGGKGGGALDPITGSLVLGFAALALAARLRRRSGVTSEAEARRRAKARRP
jgi:Ca-activated chloride channel family protein